VQHFSQSTVVSQSDIAESLVEAGNRTAIHFIVLPVPAVHPDDGRLVTTGNRIRGRATEGLGPVLRLITGMLSGGDAKADIANWI
jgi:hypothetical protein